MENRRKRIRERSETLPGTAPVVRLPDFPLPEYAWLQYNTIPQMMLDRLFALIERDGLQQHMEKMIVLDECEHDREKMPLNANPEIIKNRAESCAKKALDLFNCSMPTVVFPAPASEEIILSGVYSLCDFEGVNHPQGETFSEKMNRAVCPNWWARNLRKQHLRRVEQVSIQIGLTGIKQGVYVSDYAALLQKTRNACNAKMLENTTLSNEFGQEYSLAELAALGTANKTIRRGELMTRIRGFDEIAQECKHVGVFVTLTCPSEFHSVGAENENYSGKTPRESQAYLCHAWSLIRSKLHRQGLRLYGFRIAEPHSDGCPHWHILLFVGPSVMPKDWHAPMVRPYNQWNSEQAAVRVRRIITLYSRAWHPHESGAKENRIVIKRIEAGRGTAAGYIAKYVAKNIDGAHVGEHRTREQNGQNWIIQDDLIDGQKITPSERVTLWAQIHGIRQFQQIGGAPVSVWRELRRIKAETVQNAPETIRAAWLAVQAIKGAPEVAKQADWAEYLRAQGGAAVGRGANIKIEKKEVEIISKYAGAVNVEKPCGVFTIVRAIKRVYESVRYKWKVKAGANPKGATEPIQVPKMDMPGFFGVGFELPWTGVNNCTQEDFRKMGHKFHQQKNRWKNPVVKEFKPVFGLDLIKEAKDFEEKYREWCSRMNNPDLAVWKYRPEVNFNA